METQQQQLPPARSAPAPRPGADQWQRPAAPSVERVREMLGWRLFPVNAGRLDRD